MVQALVSKDHVEREIVLVLLIAEVNCMNERWIHVGIGQAEAKHNADRCSAICSVNAFGEAIHGICVKSQ